MYDVIIIGAGVTGCAVAREFSKYEGKVLVLEKASDIGEGTSKANSGIVHAGFDAIPGSLKAKLNVSGNQMMEQLSKDLDIPFQRNGSMVLCFQEQDIPKLEELMKSGIENGVKDLAILRKEEIKRREPNVSEEAVAALFAPGGGIVCPFHLTLALAENAFENGVEFKLNTEVTKIMKKDQTFLICTNQGDYQSKIVVNAAGVYADVFHNMVSKKTIQIIPRKGEYCLMDKAVGKMVTSTLFQLPTQYGKGVLVTPTVHGNLLIGPTAVDILDKEGIQTTQEGLDSVLNKASLSVKTLPKRQIITSFAGLRAHEKGGDFIIGEVEDVEGFVDVAGVESPGLTCAPAIGEYVVQLILQKMPSAEKKNFKATRVGIKKEDHYGQVICRCEMVTEGEILAAIHRPLGATTVDGVKRRTRAGMGRCQSGFCAPKTVEILARELGKKPEEITKAGGNSFFLMEVE